jgi:ZIP family zinc transporter
MASDTIATTIASTLALGIGIGLQNIPEGAAISLPLKEEGFSSKKAFIYGTLSGVVEPISGILGVFLIGSLISVMPWLLSFAAGAMIYVVAEELIPEANKTEHSNLGTIGVMIGFVIMMTLDIALA